MNLGVKGKEDRGYNHGQQDNSAETQCQRFIIDFQSPLLTFVGEERFDIGIQHMAYTSNTAADISGTWAGGNEDDIRVLARIGSFSRNESSGSECLTEGKVNAVDRLLS